MTSVRCFPLLYCSTEFHNWEEVGYEFVSDSDIATDLAPLSRSECARRGLRHSSEDESIRDSVPRFVPPVARLAEIADSILVLQLCRGKRSAAE